MKFFKDLLYHGFQFFPLIGIDGSHYLHGTSRNWNNVSIQRLAILCDQSVLIFAANWNPNTLIFDFSDSKTKIYNKLIAILTNLEWNCYEFVARLRPIDLRTFLSENAYRKDRGYANAEARAQDFPGHPPPTPSALEGNPHEDVS